MILPDLTSHSLTVPSSELVITNFLLNWRHVTADWCLLGPRQFNVWLINVYLINQLINPYLRESEGTVLWEYPKFLRLNLHFLTPKYCPAAPFLIKNSLINIQDNNIWSWHKIPDVSDWWPIRACLQVPVSTSQTRMLVSRLPETTWIPSN